MRASFAFAAVLALVSSAFATDYDVEVGPNSQLAFSPPFVHANRGDIVRFHLYVAFYQGKNICTLTFPFPVIVTLKRTL